MTQDKNFLRGSQPLAPAVHIVIVTLPTGAQVLRRCSLNIVQLRAVEDSLMRLQHDGHIKSYVFTAAQDCDIPELLKWIDSLAYQPSQPELLHVAQDLFSLGGGQ